MAAPAAAPALCSRPVLLAAALLSGLAVFFFRSGGKTRRPWQGPVSPVYSDLLAADDLVDTPRWDRNVEWPQKKGSEDNNKVVLISQVFGANSARVPWLRLFVKTACLSGAHYLLVGDPVPPFALCPNVRHHHITWDEHRARIAVELKKVGYDNPGMLRRGIDKYKAIDFKPLLGSLFSEQIQGYEYWGYIDVDMLMGDVMGFVGPFLGEYDIITPLPTGDLESFPKDQYPYSTWGPFTLFRNTPNITELWRDIPNWGYAVAEAGQHNIDEWGGFGHGWNYSMTKFVNDVRDTRKLRIWAGIRHGADWECVFHVKGSPYGEVIPCGSCIWQHDPDTDKVMLRFNRTGLTKPVGDWQISDVLLCHFSNGKKEIDKHTTYEALTFAQRDRLLLSDKIYFTFENGFFSRIPNEHVWKSYPEHRP